MSLGSTIDDLSVCDHCGKKYRYCYDYYQCVQGHCIICGSGTVYNFFCELQLRCRSIKRSLTNPSFAWSTDPDKRPLPRPDKWWGYNEDVVQVDSKYL